jgi:hypothetical protein
VWTKAVESQYSIAVDSIIIIPDRCRELVTVTRLSVVSGFILVVILAIKFTIEAISVLAVALVTRPEPIFSSESFLALSIEAHSSIHETSLFGTQSAIAFGFSANLLLILPLYCGMS